MRAAQSGGWRHDAILPNDAASRGSRLSRPMVRSTATFLPSPIQVQVPMPSRHPTQMGVSSSYIFLERDVPLSLIRRCHTCRAAAEDPVRLPCLHHQVRQSLDDFPRHTGGRGSKLSPASADPLT